MSIGHVKGFVWFADDKIVGGRVFRRELQNPNRPQKLMRRKYESGTYCRMKKPSFVQALEAFDAFLLSPGSFSIETSEGCRTDFLYKKGAADVFLDVWFFGKTIAVFIDGRRKAIIS